MPAVTDLYSAAALTDFAQRVLQQAGMEACKASDVAEVLVEGDCLGKSTHGLALLPLYLQEIRTGGMTLAGHPDVVSDTGVCVTWDGRKLPGPWLVRRAVAQAVSLARRFGSGTVAIQRSHHTACLGAYLRQATDAGCMLLLTLTDPGHRSVAPYGGVTPVLTSNPIAFGAPGPEGPILIDMSTALITNGTAATYARRGEALPDPVLLDNRGHPSDDPAVLSTTPPGSILPIGGMTAGYKGYALGLMVELLTGCLSGRGRAGPNDGWSAAVLIMALDPAAFGGASAYATQVAALARSCHDAVPRPGFERVDLPGENALQRERVQRAAGVNLSTDIVAALTRLAEQAGVSPPEPLR